MSDDKQLVDVPEAPKSATELSSHSCDGGLPEPQVDPTSSPVPPPPEGKKRILLGIPMLDIKYEFFESFTKLWTQLLTESPEYEIMYQVAYRKPVHMAEEFLVKVAQYNKCTHLLLMDDDIYDVTKEQIDSLVRADKDVIGGIMHASKFPHAMCAFRRYDKSKSVRSMPIDNTIYRLYEIPCQCSECGTNQTHWDARYCTICGNEMSNLIQQADLIPFALTLIKMDVFDKIEQPWFHCNSTYPTDSWFADRLIDAGLTEYAHMGVRLNHAGITDLTKPHYIAMGMDVSKAKKAVVELTHEQMEAHEKMLTDRMNQVEQRTKSKPPVIDSGKVVANTEQPNAPTLITHGK